MERSLDCVVMNDQLVQDVKKSFLKHFAREESFVVKAPGRINLIGEHTDYNDGFVLPAAVGQSIYFAIGPSTEEGKSVLISVDYGERFEFDTQNIEPLPKDSWQNYILGVVAEIQKLGLAVPNFSMAFSGDVPKGAGMSSSAALECGTAFALNRLFDLKLDKLELVKLSQKAEHNYAKVMCGIMDQFASMMGHLDQALLLDCRSLAYDYFPIHLDKYTLILCNSNVSHSLASSEYNVRRWQCETGVFEIQKGHPDVLSLRDVTMEILDECRDRLDSTVYNRCKYVIEENERVHSFAKALSSDNLVEAGKLLQEAHQAMRMEYEITCPEIDFMADFANNRREVLGARMMGGGFGGCTLNLVRKGSEKTFIEDLKKGYADEFGKEMTPIEVHVSDGVGVV